MAAGNTYEAIATNTLGSTTSSVTFSSIPSTYTDLVIVVAGSLTTGVDNVCMRFNSDSGSNYSTTYILGNGSTATSARNSNLTNTGRCVMGTASSMVLYSLQNYSNTTTYKTVLGRGGETGYGVDARVSLWRNTAAITSIVLTAVSSTLTAGSTFTLYGIKAA